MCLKIRIHVDLADMTRISAIGKIRVIVRPQSKRYLFSLLIITAISELKMEIHVSGQLGPLRPELFKYSDNIPGSVHFYQGIVAKYATCLHKPLIKSKENFEKVIYWYY